jgi:hypothetical protein
MRRFLAVAGLAALAACASEPGSSSDQPITGGLPQWITGLPGEGPSFGIATLQQPPTQPGYEGFNKASPQLTDIHAAQICTLGYQKLAEETAPGEQVPFTVTQIRCNAYRPSF